MAVVIVPVVIVPVVMFIMTVRFVFSVGRKMFDMFVHNLFHFVENHQGQQERQIND